MTANTNSAQERTASIDLAQLDKLQRYSETETRLREDEDGDYVLLSDVQDIARRSLTSGSPAEPVAYLHQVVSGDGEPDQALSFAPDNFPLAGTLGYRSISHVPLSFGCSTESAAIAKKAFDAAILLASDTINAKNAEIEDLRAQLSAGAAAKTEHASYCENTGCTGCTAPDDLAAEVRATAAGAGSAQPEALNEIFAAIDEAQRMNRYNESSFEIASRVARLKCLADNYRAAMRANDSAAEGGSHG